MEMRREEVGMLVMTTWSCLPIWLVPVLTGLICILFLSLFCAILSYSLTTLFAKCLPSTFFCEIYLLYIYYYCSSKLLFLVLLVSKSITKLQKKKDNMHTTLSTLVDFLITGSNISGLPLMNWFSNTYHCSLYLPCVT